MAICPKDGRGTHQDSKHSTHTCTCQPYLTHTVIYTHKTDTPTFLPFHSLSILILCWTISKWKTLHLRVCLCHSHQTTHTYSPTICKCSRTDIQFRASTQLLSGAHYTWGWLHQQGINLAIGQIR